MDQTNAQGALSLKPGQLVLLLQLMIDKVAVALQELIGIHRNSNACAQTATFLTDRNAFPAAPPTPVQ